MKIIKLFIITIAIAAFIAACSQNKAANTDAKGNTGNAATEAPSSKPIDDLATGRKIYADNCAICHRDTGAGGKVTVDGKTLDPASLTSDKMKKRSDDKLAGEITEGVTDEGMPAFKGKLTDDQIKEVVKFIRKELQKM